MTGLAPSDRLHCLVLIADKHPCHRMDVAELFATRLASRGHRFDWLMQSSSNARAATEDWGGGTAWIGPTSTASSVLGKARKLLLDLRHDFGLIRLTRRRRYDLLIVKDKFLAVFLAVALQRWRGIPFLYWLSFPFPESGAYKAAGRRWPLSALERIRARFSGYVLYRVVARHARHLLVQSEWMKNDLAAKGIPRERMTAIPMGVSLERIAETAQAPTGSGVIYLGTLNRARRIDFLLRAFSRVTPQVPDAELFLVGNAHDPRDERELRELARSLGIEARVHFAGFLPVDQAWALARRCLIGVSPIPPTPEFLPSSPTKLVEYMALERAVIGNDLPDQRFVIDASGAGKCVDYTEEAFTDAMVELLSDPAAALRMGQLGRRWVTENRAYSVIAGVAERALLQTARPGVPVSADRASGSDR